MVVACGINDKLAVLRVVIDDRFQHFLCNSLTSGMAQNADDINYPGCRMVLVRARKLGVEYGVAQRAPDKPQLFFKIMLAQSESSPVTIGTGDYSDDIIAVERHVETIGFYSVLDSACNSVKILRQGGDLFLETVRYRFGNAVPVTFERFSDNVIHASYYAPIMIELQLDRIMVPMRLCGSHEGA